MERTPVASETDPDTERFRPMAENASDATLTFDEWGIVVAADPAAERLWGHPLSELLGSDVAMLFPEADRAPHRARVAAYREHGERSVLGVAREVASQRADGSTFTMQFSVDEAVVGGRRTLTAIARDVSGSPDAEHDRARRRDNASTVPGAIQDGLVVRRPDGSIAQVNRRFCEMTGFSEAELTGARPPFPYWPAEGPGVADLDVGEGGEADLVLRHRDGTPIPAIVSATAVHDAGGATIMYVEMVEDVTRRRAAEQALSSERDRVASIISALRDGLIVSSPEGRILETNTPFLDMGPWQDAQDELRRREIAQRESDALLATERDARRLEDEFLAMVSHELRTPLSVVLGYLELALADIADPDLRDLLEVAERNGRRLAALVRDILLVSQAGAGRLGLDRRPVRLGDLVSHAVLAARPAALAKAVTLQEDVAANPSVEGDPDRLGQVLDNLISNAIKFSPPAGGVRVGLALGGDCALITVADEGPGIPADERELLFEPFYRARQGTHDVVSGSGLGLAVVKAIAEAHGGGVSLESEMGRGSVFVAAIPLAEPGPEHLRAAAAG